MTDPPARLPVFVSLGAVLLLGVGLRMIHISDPYIVDCHSWRQADTAAFTHRYLTGSLNPLDSRIDRYPCEYRASVHGPVEAELPVGAWLAALPLAPFHVHCPAPVYLRIVSLLFFVGASLYLFLLASRLAGSRAVGVGTVFIFSVLPLSLYFTRTVQPEGPGLFFSLGFLHHLARWLDRDADVDGVASSALGALAVLQKITNVVVFLPAAYLIISRHGLRGSMKRVRYWLWGIAALAPSAAWYLHAHQRVWGFGIWAGSGKYSSWAAIFKADTWEALSQRALFEIVTWSTLILIVVGLARFRESPAVRLAAVWLLGWLVFFVATLPVNRVHSYYQLPMEVPAALLAAIGAGRVWTAGRAGKALLFILAALHGVQLVHPLQSHYYVNNGRLIEGIELLRRHVPPGASFVTTDRNPALFSNSCHQGWFVGKPQLAAIERCLGDDVEYLLLPTPVRYRFSREPATWAKLRREFTEIEATHHFSVWKKSATKVDSNGPHPLRR